jgi:O-antigen/teichoic acid export membrane protein
VAVLRQGALGNLRAQLLAAALMAVPALWITFRSGRPSWSWPLISMSLAFSLPLLPHLLGNWVLNVSDRIVLENYVSRAELGLYTLGYQFGMVLSIVGIALNNAWAPFFYQRADDHGSRRLVTLSISYQVLLMSWLALAMALLSREVIQIMANPAFWSAYLVVPWVVLGYFARYLYFFPVSGLFFAKRTKVIPVATVLAGALNIALNLWFVPHYGIMAAAVDTAIGFLFLLGLVFVLGQRRYPIGYEYGRLARAFTIAGLLFAAGWWLSPAPLWPRLAFKAVMVAAFPLLLWITGTFTPVERRRVIQLMRRTPAPAEDQPVPFLPPEEDV